MAALGLACTAAVAAPRTGLSPGEQPAASAPEGKLKVKLGLCDAPRNADAFPSSPVPVVEGQCRNQQEFKSTSPASYGGAQCGGYTTAFGPKGDLRTDWAGRHLRATWAGETLTAANCSQARVAAVAWGWRCSDAACTTGTWEKLGGPVSKKGKWNKTSKTCYVAASINAPDGVRYATLNIDAVATLGQGAQAARQPVASSILGESPNGKCPAGTAKVHDTTPPAQAASTAKGEKKLP